MRTFNRFFRFLVAGLALAVAGVAYAASLPTITPGVLLAGSDTAFPPFEMRATGNDNVNGYTGFDVDLVNAVAKEMGLKFKLQPMNFDGLIPAVQVSRIDMIMSAMTITPERAKNVTFTIPYIDSNLSILSRKKDGSLTAKDLKGKEIGAQIGTTGLAKAKSIPGTTGVKVYQTTLDAINDLKAGRIYAVINDHPVNAYVARSDHSLVTGEQFKTGDQYGFAFQRQDKALVKAFDNALRAVDENGTYSRIYKKWFAEDGVHLPK